VSVDAERLITLLRRMNAEQVETDESGGREVAWYRFRDEIENALGVPAGTLDARRRNSS